MKKSRKLKIRSKFQKRTRTYISVPEIQLEGKWLEELGFKIGSEVEVKQQNQKLIITKYK